MTTDDVLSSDIPPGAVQRVLDEFCGPQAIDAGFRGALAKAIASVMVDVRHDVTCWEQSPDGRMIACDRMKNHGGRHSWDCPGIPHPGTPLTIAGLDTEQLLTYGSDLAAELDVVMTAIRRSWPAIPHHSGRCWCRLTHTPAGATALNSGNNETMKHHGGK